MNIKEPVIRLEYTDPDGTEITLVTHGELTHTELMAKFEGFMKCIGYVYDGEYKLVPPKSK
jgi:hypothetical protein